MAVWINTRSDLYLARLIEMMMQKERLRKNVSRDQHGVYLSLWEGAIADIRKIEEGPTSHLDPRVKVTKETHQKAVK